MWRCSRSISKERLGFIRSRLNRPGWLSHIPVVWEDLLLDVLVKVLNKFTNQCLILYLRVPTFGRGIREPVGFDSEMSSDVHDKFWRPSKTLCCHLDSANMINPDYISCNEYPHLMFILNILRSIFGILLVQTRRLPSKD